MARARFSEGEEPGDALRLSDGEIHFLWWFIQGSIMDPGIRARLRRGWGFCDQHAWGALAVEAAFRHNYLHGPAVLYQDLMDRALRAFRLRGPGRGLRLAQRLRARGPCHLCDLGLGASPPGALQEARIAQGRDSSQFQTFAAPTRAYWQQAVCGRCAGDGSRVRCRPHLVEDMAAGRVADLAEHRARLDHVVAHLAVFHRSFVWGYHHTETDEDRAALISAVGWCSGWRTGLLLLS